MFDKVPLYLFGINNQMSDEEIKGVLMSEGFVCNENKNLNVVECSRDGLLLGEDPSEVSFNDTIVIFGCGMFNGCDQWDRSNLNKLFRQGTLPPLKPMRWNPKTEALSEVEDKGIGDDGIHEQINCYISEQSSEMNNEICMVLPKQSKAPVIVMRRYKK